MQRKVFRIEESFAGRRRPSPSSNDADHRHLELIGELKALRALAERSGEQSGDGEDLRRELEVIYDSIKSNQRELAAMQGDSDEGSRIARAHRELGAVIGAMELSTQQILKAAENIDESARALAATLKNDYDRGLVQDVQDQLARVYEACNFQDLGGQRIVNVMEMLKLVETHIGRVIDIWGGIDRRDRSKPAPMSDGRKLANGPKLDGDSGHASQSEIDAMFG